MAMPDEEAYYSNPRAEMMPEDYAPSWYPIDDYDDDYIPAEKDPSPYDGDYDDGGDDE
jgi:hypothetical protein